MHLLIGYLHEIQIWLTVNFNMNPIIGTLVLPNLWTQCSHWDIAIVWEMTTYIPASQCIVQNTLINC